MAAYLKITEQIDQALDLAKQNTFRLNYICWGQLAIWKHIWLLSVPHFSGIINYEKKKKKSFGIVCEGFFIKKKYFYYGCHFWSAFWRQKNTFCHHLLTLMQFQTRITFFLLRNTKEHILKNVSKYPLPPKKIFGI